VLLIRNIFFRIQVPFSSEFCIRIRIGILLDKQKVSDPVSDPTLNFYSCNKANNFKGLFKHIVLSKKFWINVFLISYSTGTGTLIIKLLIFVMIFYEFQVQFRIRIHNLELRIRILKKFRILADSDPDPQHCLDSIDLILL
jgi:hypothetical protein